MATGQQWAEGLQGMGAWFSGQGPQYEAAQALATRTAESDERQRKLDELAMDKARVEAMTKDFTQVHTFIKMGKPELGVQLLSNRIPLIEQMGGDSTDTRELLAAISDPSRIPEAEAELTSYLAAAGVLPVPGTAQASPYSGMFTTQDGQRAGLNPATGQIEIIPTVGGITAQMPAGASGDAQKGSTQIVMIGGKPYLSGSVFNPASGQWSAQVIPMEDPTGSGATVEIPDASGLPPSLRPDQKVRESAATEAGKAAIARSEAYFDRVDSARATISGIDEAIAAIDEGANTGTMAQYLPSLRESSKRLDAAGRRMGLDVVGAVTFGALSKGELDVAMATALPKDMETPQLRQWLEARKAAQSKLANYLESAAIYLGETDDSGKPHTVAGWKAMQKAQRAPDDPLGLRQ